MTATQAPPGPATPGTDVPSAAQVVRRRWRASRAIIAVILVLAVVAVVLAALRPTVQPQFLDPESPSQGGARALVQILGQRGVTVEVARSAGDAVRRARADGLTVVTRSERLTGTDLDQLARMPGDLLLVEPTTATLERIAPQVQRATATFEEAADPGCQLDAAVRAGRVDFGPSETYLAPNDATKCYTAERLPRLVQLSTGGRTVTVLGTGDPLTNERLAEEGNAALALNLAGARQAAVWLIPDLPEPGSEAERSWEDLVPLGAWLFVLQLVVAVVLAALWRMRRMGPVVAEALPVVVRSAETVEGRARLYRAHRARGQAAEALRAGARERLVPLLGLPSGAAQDPSRAREIVTAIAQRTRWDEQSIGAALYGPEPMDDVRLVGLSDALDDLERQVRES